MAVQLARQRRLWKLVAVLMTNIVGVKWFHRPCRLGCFTTFTGQRLFVPAIARTSVRAAQRTMRLSGLRCSAICLTKWGGEYETNISFNYGNCAVCIICRRTINIVPIGLCHGGGRIYGYCGWFVPIGLQIRRHCNQLSNFVTRGFVHYVCTGIYRIHRHIRHI